MLLWITVALAGSGSSDGCIPDGSALYPTVEAPLDPARVRALVGPTLAALVATYAPHTYTPNGWFACWVGALGRDRDRAGRAGLSPTSLSP